MGCSGRGSRSCFRRLTELLLHLLLLKENLLLLLSGERRPRYSIRDPVPTRRSLRLSVRLRRSTEMIRESRLNRHRKRESLIKGRSVRRELWTAGSCPLELSLLLRDSMSLRSGGHDRADRIRRLRSDRNTTRTAGLRRENGARRSEAIDDLGRGMTFGFSRGESIRFLQITSIDRERFDVGRPEKGSSSDHVLEGVVVDDNRFFGGGEIVRSIHVESEPFCSSRCDVRVLLRLLPRHLADPGAR